MQMLSFSNDFIDWIRERVLAQSGGLIVAGNLFDERAQDMAALIRKGITQGVKYCLCISLPTATRIQSDSADDTLHRVTCHIALLRGALATRSTAELAWLAESLYMAFCGASYRSTPGSERPDVYADAFKPSLTEKGAASFDFDVSVILDLDTLNYPKKI